MEAVDTHLNHLQGHFRIACTFLFLFFDNHSLMLYSYMALESYKPHIRRMVERRVHNHRCAENFYGVHRWTSEANIYKSCIDNNIHQFEYGRNSKGELHAEFALAAQHAGPTFGRKNGNRVYEITRYSYR